MFGDLKIPFNLECSSNGNYDSVQDQDGKIFCVDRDGFTVSPLSSPITNLDCDKFFYYAQEDFFYDYLKI